MSEDTNTRKYNRTIILKLSFGCRYVLTSNLGMKLECCFLSGYFFKALFCASQPHPKADSDYALYEIGEGCEVLNLIPGIDLLSDRSVISSIDLFHDIVI